MPNIVNILILALGVIASGIYALAMKPANDRFSASPDPILFNSCITFVASICAFIAFALSGSPHIPPNGLLWTAIFGILFSVTVYTNLLALDYGPLSLTTLIVNFSLVLPIIYSSVFLKEKLTVLRLLGILILIGCMFLYTNPKINESNTNSPKTRGSVLKWIGLCLISFFGNGMLGIIIKSYAVFSENAYSESFLAYSYLFATITSLVIFVFMQIRYKDKNRTKLKSFCVPIIIGCILLTGLANYFLNLADVLLATRMDATIVYPVLQGGGPIIVTLFSRLLFKEKITILKAIAVLLGCLAMILLNL